MTIKCQYNPATKKVAYDATNKKVMTTKVYTCLGENIRITLEGITDCPECDVNLSRHNGTHDLPLAGETDTFCYYHTANLFGLFILKNGGSIYGQMTDNFDVGFHILKADGYFWDDGTAPSRLILADCCTWLTELNQIKAYGGIVTWEWL